MDFREHFAEKGKVYMLSRISNKSESVFDFLDFFSIDLIGKYSIMTLVDQSEVSKTHLKSSSLNEFYQFYRFISKTYMDKH